MATLIKLWRLLTILLVVLGLGPALAHLFELPAKITFEGALWLELLHRLYPPAFGTAGAFFEVAAVAAAFVLAYLVRHRTPGFAWTLSGALLLAASHAAFWIWVAPVNAAMADLTAQTLPANWTALRDQWEYSHAARALLQLAGLSAIVISLIVELPDPKERASG